MTTGHGVPALDIAGLTKRYGGTVALDDVSVSFDPGRIYGLVGINGSGKSTLIRIVAGLEEPTALDRLAFYGRVHEGSLSMSQSHDHGVRVLHQRPAQFMDLSVTENLLLPDFGSSGLGAFSWRRAHEKARAILATVDMDIDPRARFDRFSPAERTMALIARLLHDEETGPSDGGSRRIVILDEPTAALPEAGAIWLLDKLKAQREAGHTIIYVSHRLDELFYVTDRLTVLRNGRLIGSMDTADTNERDLVTMLLGHELRAATTAADDVGTSDHAGTPRLSVKGLAGREARGIDFAVHPGEIVGITGIIGSGFLETLELIFGARTRTAGEIRIDGAAIDPSHPCEAMRAGIALVPSDRTEMAVFPGWTLQENLTIPQASVRVDCDVDGNRVIGTYGVKAPGSRAKLWTLSGGNQQKVVLARWLEREPKLLLLCEPTAGVDPGARDDLHNLIRAAAAKGCAVLVASTDADELESLVHRTLVVNRGTISDEIPGGPGSKLKIREKIL